MADTDTTYDYRARAHLLGGTGNEHLVDTVAKALHRVESLHLHILDDIGGCDDPDHTCRYCLLRAGAAVRAIVPPAQPAEPAEPEPLPSRITGENAACPCKHLIRSHRAPGGCVWCDCADHVFPIIVEPGTRAGWAVWNRDGGLLSSGPGKDGEDHPAEAMNADPATAAELIIDELDQAAYEALDALAITPDTGPRLLAAGGRDVFYTIGVRR